MKYSAITSSLLLLSLGYYDGINAEDSSSSLRGSNEQQNHRGLRMQHPCTLVRVETHYESEMEENSPSRNRLFNGYGGSGNRDRGGNRRLLHDTKRVIKCELQEEDRVAVGKYFVPVHGIESSQLEKIVSGDTTMMVDGASIKDGELWLQAGASVEFGSNGENERRRKLKISRQHGIKKVLVVRADAKGSSTSATSETLSDKIFGTYGDTATLKSQYMACSHGKLELQPYVGMTRGGTEVKNGVLDVSIDLYVPGTIRFAVEDALEEAATQLVGNLHEQFDHVMLCLPPGSSDGGWVAYGYINSWLTVYNDNFCKSMSTQVHEIGHNLGLAHSGKDGVSYGDKSGMMGFSYNRDNGPMQCFNPAKTYQLGWFDEKTVEVDPNAGTWAGTIIGSTDYSNDIVSSDANVIVKIITGQTNDLYVGYNRKKGMNSGVLLGGDRVTIVEQGEGYSQSDFLATLSEGTSKTFYNYDGTNRNLIVEFVKRQSRFDEVLVAIYFDTCVLPSCCQGPMCAQLINPPDLSVPVSVSLLSPTPAPKSSKPTLAPTTGTPTFSPTVAPTTGTPTFSPTLAPTTRTPTFNPTIAPTRQRMYDIVHDNDLPKVRKELLSENFRRGLGPFYNTGEIEVTREIFSYVLTARFPLESAWDRPSLTSVLALQGTSTVDVSFWYNAEIMQKNEGFKLQFSIDNGNSWTNVKSFIFGEDDFDATNQWNYARQQTFQVSEGMSSVQIRFVGDTDTDGSDSVFYIAGVSIYGE